MLLIIEEVLFYYFVAATSYLLLLAIAGLLYTPKQIPATKPAKRTAVFVPCYKEDGIILFVVQKLTEVSYPRHLYDIVVIADSFKQETLDKLAKLDITLLTPSFDKSSKSKSLNYALDKMGDNYDIAIILDADNIVQPDFLQRMNDAFNAGHTVVQAQRTAKNSNTSFAVLDGISEGINNHIFRKGTNAVGLSSNLIGSGIGIQYALFKRLLLTIDSVYEDRELQLAIAKERHKILYMPSVLVFDEKIDNANSFGNQRKRWFYAQFKTLTETFFPGLVQLFKGNLNYFNFSFLVNFFPPRILGIFFLFILSAVFTLVFWSTPPVVVKWWIVTLSYVGALLLAVPKRYYSAKAFHAVLQIPVAMFKSVQILFTMRNANKKFIHTEHNSLDVDKNLINENQNK